MATANGKTLFVTNLKAGSSDVFRSVFRVFSRLMSAFCGNADTENPITNKKINRIFLVPNRLVFPDRIARRPDAITILSRFAFCWKDFTP